MPDQPKRVGVPNGPDDIVARYQQGLAKRAKAASEAQRGDFKMPNLANADKAYDPKKDRPMTLSEMGQAQQNMQQVAQGEEKGSLSPETVKGLQALQQASQEEVKRQNQAPSQPTVEEEKGSPEKEEFKASPDQVAESLDSMDDLDLDIMMQRVRNDIINNETERKAIEARVDEIDLEEGLATGEFTQDVPIRPGKLVVKFRTVSPMENDHLRRILFNWNAEDARAQALSGERYGLMQTVASVVKINGTQLPRHVDQQSEEFDEKVFLQKYTLFSKYPTPLIHALGTHAFWFDSRVRKLFTTENLKNG